MVVLVLTACPAGLRGHLTRWLLEVSPGVFVGKISTRVRDLMWARVLELCKDGRAIMIFGSDKEQGMAFRVHRHDWEVIDVEGLSLMLRPQVRSSQPELRRGWSSVARARRARGRK